MDILKSLEDIKTNYKNTIEILKQLDDIKIKSEYQIACVDKAREYLIKENKKKELKNKIFEHYINRDIDYFESITNCIVETLADFNIDVKYMDKFIENIAVYELIDFVKDFPYIDYNDNYIVLDGQKTFNFDNIWEIFNKFIIKYDYRFDRLVENILEKEV